MIVINLTQQVNTDAELTALTGLNNQDIVYHNGQNAPFMFRTNVSEGDFLADDQSGYFIKDTIECLNLEQYKDLRKQQINERTAELIANGYTWAGKQFPLTQNGQINLIGMTVANMMGILTFPIDLNTIDEEERHSIANGTELYNIYGTALGTKKYYEDSGSQLKQAVVDAIDEAAVAAIVDNR